MHGIDSWQQSHWQKHRVLPHTRPNTDKSYSIPENDWKQLCTVYLLYTHMMWAHEMLSVWEINWKGRNFEFICSLLHLYIFDDKPFKNLLFILHWPFKCKSLFVKNVCQFLMKTFLKLDLNHKPAIFTVWKVRWSLICLSGNSSNTSGWERKPGLFVSFFYLRKSVLSRSFCTCIQTFYNCIFQN